MRDICIRLATSPVDAGRYGDVRHSCFVFGSIRSPVSGHWAGLWGEASAIPMVDIESDKLSISSLRISSQSLPNADAAASTVMQVEAVDCRVSRPKARVAFNEAYCRSWRRAVWSAALAKLEAYIQCDEAFSLTVVMGCFSTTITDAVSAKRTRKLRGRL